MSKKNTVKKTNNGKIILASAVILVVIAVIFLMKGLNSNKSTATASGADLKILKSEVTETAKFYPYQVGSTKMEVFAVKAKDGSIKTALNTCQVCYSSGKGYYKQNGDSLVCQNCGNVFKIDQIEKQKNGCNPVPVTGDAKKDDGTNIIVSKDFLAGKKDMFLNWGKK